jgi:hypothetical protein
MPYPLLSGGTGDNIRCCKCCRPKRTLFAGTTRETWKDWTFLVSIPAPSSVVNRESDPAGCDCSGCDSFAGTYLFGTPSDSRHLGFIDNPGVCCGERRGPYWPGSSKWPTARYVMPAVESSGSLTCSTPCIDEALLTTSYIDIHGHTQFIVDDVLGVFSNTNWIQFSYDCVADETTVLIALYYRAVRDDGEHHAGFNCLDTYHDETHFDNGGCFDGFGTGGYASSPLFRYVKSGRYTHDDCSGTATLIGFDGDVNDSICRFTEGQTVSWNIV